MQFALALPAVVLHAEAPRRLLVLGDEPVAAGRRKVREPLRLGRLNPTLAVAFGDTLGDRKQIRAGIALLWKGKVRIEALTIASVNRTAERVELAARVVDDPFDENVVAAISHRVDQRRADRHRAALNDQQRAGRVRAAELDGDAYAVARRLSEVLFFAQHSRQLAVPYARSESQVYEPGDRFDLRKEIAQCGRVLGDVGDQLRRDLLRRAPRRLCQRKGDVGCEVPELGTAWGLKPDLDAGAGVASLDGRVYCERECAQRIFEHRGGVSVRLRIHRACSSPFGRTPTRA